MALRLGVIGYGNSAGDFVRAAQYAGGWEMMCAGGRNLDKAHAFAAEHSIEAGTAEEVCAREDVEVIAIATPPGTHRQYSVEALQQGKHVIVEKPMALTLEDCDAIISAAEKSGRLVTVAQTQRYYGNGVVAKQVIDRGDIGDVLMIHEHMYDNSFAKRSGWHTDAALSGGGIVFNSMPHIVDRIRCFSGAEVAEVSAMLGYCNAGTPGIEGNAHVMLRLDNGGTASILYHGYNAATEKFCATVCGSAGIIKLSGFNRECRVYRQGEEMVEKADTLKRNDTDPVNEGYLNLLTGFGNAIVAGTAPPVSGADGRAAVAVCLAILESAKTGKVVTIE